jgi:hypothetical protein
MNEQLDINKDQESIKKEKKAKGVHGPIIPGLKIHWSRVGRFWRLYYPYKLL